MEDVTNRMTQRRATWGDRRAALNAWRGRVSDKTTSEKPRAVERAWQARAQQVQRCWGGAAPQGAGGAERVLLVAGELTCPMGVKCGVEGGRQQRKPAARL